MTKVAMSPETKLPPRENAGEAESSAVSDSDEELILRVKDGNHGAFAMLVQRHTDKFYGLAYRYLAHREEAEDLVQAAFLKLWERPQIWQPDKNAKFTTWFYQVVVNMCLDKKKKNTPLALDEDFQVGDDREDQEATAIENQQKRRLEAAIQKLPKRQKTALNLCFYEELSQQEASAIMGINIKALQSLVMRAKATLKKECMV